MNIFRKIRVIALSRLRKPKEEGWVEDRRQICKKCTHNSLNSKEKRNVKAQILMWLSGLYSFLTGRKEEDNLGNCMACESCSIYFKTNEKIETCPVNQW